MAHCDRRDYFQGSLNAHFVRVVPGTPINVPVVVASSVFIFFTLIICGLESWLNTCVSAWNKTLRSGSTR